MWLMPPIPHMHSIATENDASLFMSEAIFVFFQKYSQYNSEYLYLRPL